MIRPVPKPTPKAKKPRKSIPRGKPPKAKKRPKARNVERQKRNFAFSYHSKERVEWVKTLPCCVASSVCGGEVDNAHTESGKSMGKKGPYQSIAPLCRWHHRRYDLRYGPFELTEKRTAISRAAANTQQAWLAVSGAAEDAT